MGWARHGIDDCSLHDHLHVLLLPIRGHVAQAFAEGLPRRNEFPRSLRTEFADDVGTGFTAAAHLARTADVAIVFVNQWMHEGEDVSYLSLPDYRDEAIRQVAAANPHRIAVLETGGAVLKPWIDKANAVLEAWHPGQRGGEAIASILFGDTVPYGKLPITSPKSEADLPHSAIAGRTSGTPSHRPETPFDVNYSEGLKVGYKWYYIENKSQGRTLFSAFLDMVAKTRKSRSAASIWCSERSETTSL